MKKIKLKVFGVQDYGEFSDSVSKAYFGTFSDDGELVVEYTQKAENKSVLNKIEVDKNLKKAKIIKDNREKNAVVVEKNKTNLCNYLTDFGVYPLEIFGKEIDVKIDENGGKFKLSYDIYNGGELTSKNTVTIDFKFK